MITLMLIQTIIMKVFYRYTSMYSMTDVLMWQAHAIKLKPVQIHIMCDTYWDYTLQIFFWNKNKTLNVTLRIQNC